MATIKRSEVARGQGRGKDDQRSTEDFQSAGTSLCDTVMRDPHHYTSVKTQRIHKAKSEPQCKLQTGDDNNVSV